MSAPDRDRVLESATPVDPVRTLRFHKMGRGDGTYRVGEGWIAFAARTPEGPPRGHQPGGGVGGDSIRKLDTSNGQLDWDDNIWISLGRECGGMGDRWGWG